MLPPPSAVLCPFAAAIRHPPHCCRAPCFCYKALWTREWFSSTKPHHVPSHMFVFPPSFSSLRLTFWLIGNLSGEGQLLAQHAETQSSHIQMSSTDLWFKSMLWRLGCRPICSKRKRVALTIRPTTQTSGGICTFVVDPSPSCSRFITQYSDVLLGCSVHICVVLLLMSLY